MKNWMKRSLAVLLCMVMVLTLLPAEMARAEGDLTITEVDDEDLIAVIEETDDGLIEETDDEIVIVDTETESRPVETEETIDAAVSDKADLAQSYVYIEPIYRSVVSEEELLAQLNRVVPANELLAQSNAVEYFSTISSAASYMRKQMLNRNETVSFMIPYELASASSSIFRDLIDAAVEHTESCSGKEGDALRYGYIGWSGNASSAYNDDGVLCYQFTYTFKWTATYDQEKSLTSKVNSAMSSLSLSGKSETDKIKAIHDYICSHVDYDHEHLSQGADYPLQFSAYAALCEGTAVCQGYAVLFYRMAKEAGLGVRVVTSNDHAWNIVRIGSKYYNIDTTWDGQDAATYYYFYLKTPREFQDHPREAPYYTDEFESAYPMVKDSKMNASNLSRSFTTVADKTVSSTASGKPKVLIFGSLGTNTATGRFVTSFCDYNFSNLDVYVIDTGNSSKSDVKNYRTAYGGGAATFCYDTSSDASSAMWSYLSAVNYPGSYLYYPVIIFIDANDKIQNYRVCDQGPATMAAIVKDFLGTTLSYAAPRITQQPTSQSAADANVNFSVAAVGHGSISYQWQYRTSSSGTWNVCTAAGYNTANYSVKATSARNGYQFRCKVTNAQGSTYSNTVTLKYTGGVSITSQPSSKSVKLNDTATFAVKASGSSLKYQWQYRTSRSGSWNNSGLSTAKTSTLKVKGTSGVNGYQYRCKVSNSSGSVYSYIVTLTVVTAPTITTQPKSMSAALDSTASFTVKASGGGLSYQWQYRKDRNSSWNNSSLSSAKTATVKIKATSGLNGYQYRCKVTNAAGTVYSYIVTLTVTNKPVITTQPSSKSVKLDNTATFAVKASGSSLKYQWQYRKDRNSSWNNSGLSTAKTSTLKVKATSGLNGYQYRCKVSNASGTVYSYIVTLTVVTAPTITTQPKSMSAALDSTASFTVKASGGGLSYQWQYRKNSSASWVNSSLSSAKTATVKIKATSGMSGYQYRCKVTNAAGTVYSYIVTLTVGNKPAITTQPSSKSVKLDNTATFAVKASGSGLKYQWQYRKDRNSSWVNSSLSSAKTSTIKLKATSGMNGYQYRCKVSNANGTVYSYIVTLTVLTKPSITTQPSTKSVALNNTATFTVKASGGGLSYQWQYRKNSSSSWVNSSLSSAKTATIKIKATSGMNGYQYRCKVTNSMGSATSSAATLKIVNKPTITSHPSTVTVKVDNTATFTVKASGATGYQWQYRKNSSSSWVNSTLSTAKTATLKLKATSGLNGYQYRCKVSNSNGSVYSNSATLKVNLVKYRALLVGEVNFSFETANRNKGDVELMSNMLKSVKGPAGGTYSVTCKYNLDTAGVKNAISTTFASADDNDVSLFFIATHGVVDVASGPYAGELLTIASDGSNDYMTLGELADALKTVPGKVIVLLGSCGSGAAIVENGIAKYAAGDTGDAFNTAVIEAFAAVDENLPEEDIAVPNTGEFRNSKFYVLTAAAHQESSWGSESLGYNFFTYSLATGAGSSKPADANGNGTITMLEMYNYVKTNAYGPYNDGTGNYYQHVQMYPANSSYALFK